MSATETVTIWIQQLKDGDDAVVEKLWQRYFDEMVRLANRRLAGAKRTTADEEDVALSAFKSFCLGAQQGKYPRLSDRDSLWSLLVAITANKSVDHIRRENRQKRGGSGGVDSTDFTRRRASLEPLSEIVGHEPTPEFAALISDELEHLLEMLVDAKDPDLLTIAISKLIGESTSDVARQLGCAERSVQRKLKVIRRVWEESAE